MAASILEQLRAEGDAAPQPGDLVITPPGASVIEQLRREAPAELTTAQKIVRGAAPSIVGGAIGGAIGTAVAPGPGTVIGTMLGSGAGEAVTQFFDPLGSGVTDPSLLQIGAATAVPVVPAAARRFFMSLPGAAAGLQESLFRTLGHAGERVVAAFAPIPGTAKRLFEAARQSGAHLDVPVTETARATATIAKEVGESKFATSGSAALAKKAQAFVTNGAVNFNEFRLNQSDLGAVVRSLDRKGGAAAGRAKQLYAAMWDDLNAALAKPVPIAARPIAALPPVGGTSPPSFGPTGRFVAQELTGREGVERTLEAAAASARGEAFREGAGQIIARAPGDPAGQLLRTAAPTAAAPVATAVSPAQETLRRAIDAFKREEAASFVKEWFTASTARRVGQRNIDVDALMTKIDRNRDVLKKLIPEDEIGEMLTTLAPLAKVPIMAKTPQLGFQTTTFGDRVVGGLLGAAAGSFVGPGGALGGAAVAVAAVEAISVGLTTRPGRLFIRTLAEKGATVDQIGNVLMQSGRVALTPKAAPARPLFGAPMGGR